MQVLLFIKQIPVFRRRLLSTKFTAIEVFCSSYDPCVETGDYLVQVTGNNSAHGLLFITVDVSDTLKGSYDKPLDASQFLNLDVNKQSVTDFFVDCQSIEYPAENCQPNGSFKDFTKSTGILLKHRLTSIGLVYCSR